ncbi:MAG: hypothetical protein ACRCTI_16745 [Beijerinckiaceae bacterium]
MRLLLLAAALLPLASPARADFAVTDLTRVELSGFDTARWSARQEPARLTLHCTGCPGISAIDVQISDDDGTGGRVRSGETTASTMEQIGRANAARNPGASEYYGAEAVVRGGAVGFRQEAKALSQFVVTYVLWDGGKRLIVRGMAPDRAAARSLAAEGFEKVAGQIAR